MSAQEMPESPIVSVIIPTYNRASMLTRAVESVLGQTYENLELIVVDDASNDATEQVVLSIGDQRLRYVRLPENRGAAAARNVGLGEASGKYVTFLDSDDIWLPARLESYVRVAEADGEAEVDTVYYGETINDDGLKQIVVPWRPKREDETIAAYTFRANCDMNPLSLMLRRELACQVMFTEGLKRHQDVDFLMRLEAAGVRFAFVPGPMGVYNRDGRADRISLIKDPEPSVAWVESWRERMSAKDIRAFYARIVAPIIAVQGQRAKGLRYVLEATWTRSIRLVDALKYSANIVLPPWTSDRLKVMWGRISRARHISQ